MRPTLYGNRHAVSAGHYLAAALEVIVAEPKPGFLRAGADPRQPAYA
ncbi:MAG: hypothetical protein GY794_26795, partial [bacterium]|nr:hypothetical protein [bacterium]